MGPVQSGKVRWRACGVLERTVGAGPREVAIRVLLHGRLEKAESLPLVHIHLANQEVQEGSNGCVYPILRGGVV